MPTRHIRTIKATAPRPTRAAALLVFLALSAPFALIALAEALL